MNIFGIGINRNMFNFILLLINAILPLVSLVALNSSQFIDFGKVGHLKTKWEDISSSIWLTAKPETSILSAISFSDCFFVSSNLIWWLVLLEIFLYSTRFDSAIKVLLQCLQRKRCLWRYNLVRQFPCFGILTMQFFLKPHLIISFVDWLIIPQQGQ